MAQLDMRSPMRLPDFRAFWIGQLFVMLGGQFFFIALTWLVLIVTGTGTELGTVLMVNAIPRAVLMLVGGAVSDRFAPRSILFGTAVLRTLLTVVLTLLITEGQATFLSLIIIAGFGGLSDAFFMPASMAILPRLVSPPQLASANAFSQGAEQLTSIIGPALAGWSIGAFGLELTFGINVLFFAVGSFLLLFIRRSSPAGQPDPQADRQNILESIREGIQYAWRDPVLRLCLLIVAALNFAMIGPALVGGAKLADLRFGSDASVFGNIIAVYGVGALIGVVASGALGIPRQPGRMLAGLGLILAGCLFGFGVLENLWLIYVVALVMGLGGGYASIAATVWLQARTEARLQGRVMSLLMFAAMALDPFSQAVSGFLVDLGLPVLFTAAAVVMLLTSVLAFRSSAEKSDSGQSVPESVSSEAAER